jgi:predicted extracellular nuclease
LFCGRLSKKSASALLISTLIVVFNTGFHRTIASGDNSLALTSICKIQGDGFQSPYEGRSIRTQGIVYADFDDSTTRGFFIQDENCDGNPETSDGVFIYLAERVEVVDEGDLVEVAGEIQEYFGMTEVIANAGDVAVLSTNNPLPIPVELSPPFDNPQTWLYFEALESMHVKLDDAAVVGPTDGSNETWVVRTDLALPRIYPDDPLGTGEIVCLDDEGIYQVEPQAKVGDRLLELQGALDYAVGVYRMQLTQYPTLIPGTIPSLVHSPPRSEIDAPLPLKTFSVATFNLGNMFDAVDDPLTDDDVLSAAEYQRRLNKRALAIHDRLNEPEIIAIQEAENQSVLEELILRPEIIANYGIALLEGPDIRGMDVALLYRTDVVSLLSYQQHQGCTDMIDGLGPDGNQDMGDPQNAITCDINGNGQLDGNRLFSRPPLVVHLTICDSGCANEDSTDEFVFIVNHLKSKRHDSFSVQYTLPRRIEQAQYIVDLVEEIREDFPNTNLVVLGDLNDLPNSMPLNILRDAGLRDLVSRVPKTSRYSFIYQGVSQVLDYALASLSPGFTPLSVTPIHINADFPAVFNGVEDTYYRSSDHDPLLVQFVHFDHLLYLPIVSSDVPLVE